MTRLDDEPHTEWRAEGVGRGRWQVVRYTTRGRVAARESCKGDPFAPIIWRCWSLANDHAERLNALRLT